MFTEDEDADYMVLSIFLLYEYLKGDKSFWFPYINIMNEADLAAYWSDQELEELQDPFAV